MYEVRERDGSVSAASENWRDVTAARSGDAIIWDSARWAVAGAWQPITPAQTLVRAA